MLHINKEYILFLKNINANPYFNMATDEYFLNLVEQKKIKGILRFYTWSPLSISMTQQIPRCLASIWIYSP